MFCTVLYYVNNVRVSVPACVCVLCVCTHVCRGQRKLVELGSLLSSQGAWSLTSGHQYGIKPSRSVSKAMAVCFRITATPSECKACSAMNPGRWIDRVEVTFPYSVHCVTWTIYLVLSVKQTELHPSPAVIKMK